MFTCACICKKNVYFDSLLMHFFFFQTEGTGKVQLGLNLVKKDFSGFQSFDKQMDQKMSLTKKQVKRMGKQLKKVQQAVRGFTRRLFLMRSRTRKLLRELKQLEAKKVCVMCNMGKEPFFCM